MSAAARAQWKREQAMALQRIFAKIALMIFAAGGWMAAAGADAAQAGRRVALVIGNSQYEFVPRLANPASDARLIADTLREVGFSLVGEGPQLDLDEAGLRGAVRAFGEALQGADVGLFYYAGHALEVRRANYLVPIGANPTREADVDFQMLDANLVLRQMQGAGTKLNIVILDACRNNPFSGRGLRATSRGLAQMRAPEGTLISFATQPGNVARDGADGHSPYTRVLADVIKRPGMSLFDSFNAVGLAVTKATGGEQQPWVSSSPISGQFHFTPKQETAAPAPANAGPAMMRADEVFWLSIRDSDVAALFEEFLKRFPKSEHAREARARFAALTPEGGASDGESKTVSTQDARTERLLTSLADGAVAVYARETRTSVVFRLVSEAGWSPAFNVDVNQNGKIDAHIDTAYGLIDPTTPCTQYRISQAANSLCGALHSREQFRATRRGGHRIVTRAIPKSELSRTGAGFIVQFSAWNKKRGWHSAPPMPYTFDVK